MSDDKQPEGVWLKVFCPGARCLTPEEVVDLPEDKRQAAAAQGKEGLWLEVFCPDQACLTDAERAAAPEKAAPAPQAGPAADQEGYWLKLFCPGDACQIDDGSKAP